MARGRPDFAAAGYLAVTGEDQVHTIMDPIAHGVHEALAPVANRRHAIADVPVDRIRVVTIISALDVTTGVTRIDMGVQNGAADQRIASFMAPAADQAVTWTGHLYLINDYYLWIDYIGSLVNDAINSEWFWHDMVLKV